MLNEKLCLLLKELIISKGIYLKGKINIKGEAWK